MRLTAEVVVARSDLKLMLLDMSRTIELSVMK